MRRGRFAAAFNDLNDFPGLEKRGRTEIWYMTQHGWRSQNISFGDDVDTSWIELGKTHKLLGTIGETNLEKIFHLMQGEQWSPNGEARNFIRSNGFVHTSMSVGDIVKIGNKTFIAAMMGFQDISAKVASARVAHLTDEKAVDLVNKRDDLIYKINFHVDNIDEGLQNADDQIRGLQQAGGGIIDASEILKKNVAFRVEALRNFCNNILKQLE